MIQPKYVKPGDTIGVTALSHGIDTEDDRARFMKGKEQLEDKGYKVIFTGNVFTADRQGRSSSGKVRAEQFHELLKNPEVTLIHSASGGNYLLEALKYIDFGLFREYPKWVMGYSDNTSLLYPLTTLTGISTVYGANFGDFGMCPWDISVQRNLGILEGTCKVQESFEYFQNGFLEREDTYAGYSKDGKVKWRNIYLGGDGAAKKSFAVTGTLKDQSEIAAEITNCRKEKISMEGRLLGGCLDVLLDLAGTPYDGTLKYIERAKDDGIIWFLESFGLNTETLLSGLWKLDALGWFKYAKGFIFGRPMFFEPAMETGYDEALIQALGHLGVPIIMNADIGHKGPQFAMIEGALARIESEAGKGKVTYL